MDKKLPHDLIQLIDPATGEIVCEQKAEPTTVSFEIIESVNITSIGGLTKKG